MDQTEVKMKQMMSKISQTEQWRSVHRQDTGSNGEHWCVKNLRSSAMKMEASKQQCNKLVKRQGDKVSNSIHKF